MVLLSRGVGLAAMISVSWRPDSPRSEGDENENDELEQAYISEHPRAAYPPDPWLVSLELDTAYGYQGDNGSSCDDLHAWLLHRVISWLGDRSVSRWAWRREYNGYWYTQDDGPESVRELGDPEKGTLI